MVPKAPTRRVFLIGFMGAGKTSVGRALAQRLGWTFQDLDELIEKEQGRTVGRIFAEAGETGFRRMEHAALLRLLQQTSDGNTSGMIVALGGGVFTQQENREALNRAGAMIVLLEAPIDELRQRCAGQGDVRPLALDAEKFAELYAARQACYELAPLRVQNVNKTVEQTAAEIEKLIVTAEWR